jgi:hypothetical protein
LVFKQLGVFMKKFAVIACALAFAPLASVQAATTVSVVAATPVYSGPAVTYDFEGLTPISGGNYKNVSDLNGTRPTGSTGNYYAVGGVNGNPAILDLSSFLNIGSLSFLWGTPDNFNLLEVLDGGGNSIFEFRGNPDVSTTLADSLVTLNFDDATSGSVKALRFTATGTAFEIDNVAVRAVPEPGVWAMMLIGFAAMGFSLRRRENKKLRVRFA